MMIDTILCFVSVSFAGFLLWMFWLIFHWDKFVEDKQ